MSKLNKKKETKMKNEISIMLASVKASLLKVFAIFLAFILPIQPLIITVGLCIAADTIMGIWRSKKLKQAITSRKLSNVISKMVLYQSALLLFFCIEKFILADFIGYFVNIPWFLTKIVACTLAFIELKSISESYTLISGYSLWSKFKEMIKRGKDLKGDIEDFSKKE